MRIGKRLLAGFLVFVMLIGLLPVNVIEVDAATTYYWPTPTIKNVNQAFSSGHDGIDIGSKGHKIYAIASGEIVNKYTGCKNYNGASSSGTWCKDSGTCPSSQVNDKESNSSYGYCNYGVGNGFIVLQDDGYYVQYAHMDPTLASLSVGDKVTAGTYLGTIGSSGMSKGAHLHLQVGAEKWDKPININPKNSDITYSGGTGSGKALTYNTTWYDGEIDPPETPDPITFDSVWVNEITNTTAHVQADVTWDGTALKQVGVKWGLSTSMVNTPLTDTPGSVLTKIYYDFGSGDYPSLLSGTTYYYQFFAIDNNNKEYLSAQANFKTTGSAQKSTFSFNANGGSGSMSSISVAVGGSATLPANTFTKSGYDFAGWNVKRGDGKWYTSSGWQTDSAITSNGYTKKVYEDNYGLSYDQSWYRDLTAFQSYTFYAIWEEAEAQEYTGRYYGNYSGKNYVYDSMFNNGLDSRYWFSRDTSAVTLEVDKENTYIYGPSLKVNCLTEGASGKDITIRTTTQPGNNVDHNYVGDNRTFNLSFAAKASVPGTGMHIRWGYQPVAEYTVVDLSDDWIVYSINMTKENSFGTDLHIYFDTPGTVWLTGVQVEDGENDTEFANEQGPSGTFTYIGGEALGTLPEITRPGYSFDGWYTQNQGGTKVTESTIAPNGGFNLYAHWTMTDASLAEIAFGNFGDGLRWGITADGRLTISGTGDMPDYQSAYEAPWSNYAEQITSVVVESGVSYIGDNAFTSLSNVTSVGLSDSIVSIGEWAFSGLGITAIDLPEGLTTIGEGAFSITKLTTVTIPSTVTAIGNMAFIDAPLSGILVSEGNTAYKSVDGVLFTIDGTNLHTYPKSKTNTTYTLPNGVTSIPASAFAGNTYLTNIVVPASVTSVGGFAFSVNNLEEVKFLGNAPAFDENAFYDATVTAYYPVDNDTWTEEVWQNYGGTVSWVSYDSNIVASGSCGESAFWKFDNKNVLTIYGTGAMDSYTYNSNAPWYSYTSKITKIVIEDGITHVGDRCFQNYQKATSIILADSITSFGQDSFDNCRGITTIDLPDNLTDMGKSAFSNCQNLTSVEIPASVEVITQSSFEGCTYLTSVTIPDGVTTIGRMAFFYCENLRQVTLPESVTTIEKEAFQKCRRLDTITMPGVKTIGENAFATCDYGLYTLVLPEGLESIGQYAFKDCAILAEVTLPSTLKEWGYQPFYGCNYLMTIEVNEGSESFTAVDNVLFDKDMTSLILYPANRFIKTYTIPVGVETIKEAAFRYAKITTLDIPASVKTIETAAFNYCTSLTEITLLGNAPKIATSTFTSVKSNVNYPGNDTTYTTSVMQNYGGTLTWVPYIVEVPMESITFDQTAVELPIGETVELIVTIQPEDTTDDKSLVWTTSDDTVATVENGVITAVGAGECTIIATAVNGLTAECTVTVPKPVVEDKVVVTGYSGDLTWELRESGTLVFNGSGAMKNYIYKSEMPWYQYMDQIKSVVLNDGITRIGSYAFYGMTSMESITIAETVTSIGDYAFKNAIALDGVVLPAGLTSLGESAFYGCTSLTAIEIPVSLYTVKPYTFKHCTSLASVIFHEGNLMKLSDGAFYGTALKEVSFPACLDIIDVYCFKNCTELAEINIPEGDLTQVREAVFYGTAISSITIPEGVMKIGPYAFKNCANLASVDLPETLTSLGEASFYACTALEAMVIPDAVTAIGNYAFRKCTTMTSVKFGAELTNIGESSFYGCEGLTELTFGNKVTTIQGYAFKGCTGLTKVILPKSLVTLGESAFHTCTKLTEITIPASVTKIGDYSFSGCKGIQMITFKGSAPLIGTGAFNNVNAEAVYTDDGTWTSDKKQNYGGKITWNEL